MNSDEKQEKESRKRRDNGKNEGVIMPVPVASGELPEEYISFLKKIKEQIRSERLKTVLAANSALVMMYWDIGYSILQKQKDQGWGAKIIGRLSADLKENFPVLIIGENYNGRL